MRLAALRPTHVVFLVAVLLLATLTSRSSAATTCLQGAIDMAMSEDGSAEVFCNSTVCTVAYAMMFDPSTVETGGPWPIDVQFADGSYASELFPSGGFVNVTISCDGLGDITAASSAGPNGEHIELIWNYSTADSTDCAAILQSIDLAANFTAFEVMLSYSGSESGVDALASSAEADEYSIAAQTVECQDDISTTATTADTTATTETTATTTTTTSVDNSTNTNSTDDSVTVSHSVKKQRNIWMGIGIAFIVVCVVLSIILLIVFVWAIWETFKHRHGMTPLDHIRDSWFQNAGAEYGTTDEQEQE